MRVPFLDLRRHHAPMREAILARLTSLIDAQSFILGPAVSDFEAALAAYCGVPHAVGVSSGTDALLAALMALEVGPGDEVVTTAFTFFATAGAVARLGARPVFADIEEESFLLDPAAALSLVGPRTKVLLPVHLFGRMVDAEAFRAAQDARPLALVEDAAQAIGAQDARGRRAGAVGDLGCFSFFPAKNLGAMGDGGGVTCSDDALAECLRVLRVHGSKPKYYHHVVGGNFRLDALQAAVLSVKIAYLEEVIRARGRNAARYRALFDASGLTASGDVVVPTEGPGRHAYHQFVIRARARDALQAFLRERGVETMVYYPTALHLQPCFAGLGYREGALPHTERATREVLALPIFGELSAEEQSYVVECVAGFYRRGE